MENFTFDDLDDDKFFASMTDKTDSRQKTHDTSLSSDENTSSEMSRLEFDPEVRKASTSGTSPNHQPVVFKIRGHYESMNLEAFNEKAIAMKSRTGKMDNGITKKEVSVSGEGTSESSEESIPSEEEMSSDGEVEIIGEKPGNKGEEEVMANLAEDRLPSDEESAEEIDSEDEDLVEELSSDDDEEDEESDDAESEGEDSVHEISHNEKEGEQQTDDTLSDRQASQSDTTVNQSESIISDNTVSQNVSDANSTDTKTNEVDTTNSNKSLLDNVNLQEENSMFSEITFNDLKAAEEDTNNAPEIGFPELHSDGKEKSESYDGDKECKKEEAESSHVSEKNAQKEEGEVTTTGKKKRKRKREKDPNKKEKPEKKKGTKRRKKEKSTDDSPKKRKKTFERKNIRKIIKDQDLDEETVRAQQEEMDRKQRMLEKIERLKQSQLQSLLEDEDDLPDNENDLKMPEEITSNKIEDAEVVEISSDEDDVHMIPTEPDEPSEEHDPNNSGSHVNDAMNQPDSEGRVLVNVGHPPDEPDIFLAPLLAANVKPHQIGGIRFLYDNLVESLQQYKSTNGFGCILAHSMGLGKTLQVISFVDVFLRFSEGKRVLIIVPVNTLQNWMNEFNMWLPPEEKAKPDDGIWPRQFKVYMISDSQKNNLSRLKVVEDWYKLGGCLLMGYEMYRLLTSKKVAVSRPKKSKGSDPVLIDLVEEEKNTELMISLKTALVNPGPDLIICDEGHRIKNSCAGISQSLKNIKTRRRVVLTGYPLQNNLQEYWCMVDFTRPNFLGTKTEFANMFERPIMNGQCVDSTSQDHRLMRFRAHVLHSLLEGFVQRRSHDVLRRALPPKEEHVILVKMSSIQRTLYKAFMDSLEQTDMGEMASANPLKAFSVCCKIWNHPDILNQIVEQRRMEDNDLDIDEAKMEGEGGSAMPKSSARKGRGKGMMSDFKKSASNPELTMPYLNDKQTTISYDWAHEHLKDYQPGVLENSGKLVILLCILEKAIEIGDKVLVFSQSLFTLTLIEDYLNKIKLPNSQEYWTKNKNYFRLDGSTVSQDREKLISQFNASDNNSIHLFLLSTRAGCLGINLIGANRVVVFDASWNPCHDCQAVCRVYRYGQMKNCFVYRLVSDLTMEKKIYDRQINKQGMSNRVVDELNPINCLTRKQVDVLLQYEDADPQTIDSSLADEKQTEDQVLYKLIKEHNRWITKIPFSHESLLIDRKDQRLTTTEKKLAHQGYEMEKKMSSSYNRPSYSAFYPRAGPTVRPITIRRPIASVRPMMQPPPVMTTPIPMQPRSGQRHTLVGEVSRPPAAKIIGPGASKISTAPPALLKPGVSVQQIKLKSDIPIPNSTSADGSLQRIPAGENVLVIKTPKGVYIRTPGGKIFAVRSAPKEAETEPTMQDIITKSVAAATKIQEETMAKSAAVTVSVSGTTTSKPGEQKVLPTQKVISITPKISIVKSTVQKLKTDPTSEGSPHVIQVTNSSKSTGRSKAVNVSLIKSAPQQSLLKSKESSSDEDIAIVSLKRGRKARKEAAQAKLNNKKSEETSQTVDKAATSDTQDIVTGLDNYAPVSHKSNSVIASKKSHVSPFSENSENGHISQKLNRVPVFEKADNAPASQRSDNPTASPLSDSSKISPMYDNSPVSQNCDSPTVSQKYENFQVSEKFNNSPISDRYEYPQRSQIIKDTHVSRKHKNNPVSHKFDSSIRESSPGSRKYNQSVPQLHKNPAASEKFDSSEVRQMYSNPTTNTEVENLPAAQTFDPHVTQNYENQQMAQKYSNSASGMGARGFPFFAPSFSGPSQYMPWMGSGEPFGYPPYYGWGHPMHPMTQASREAGHPSAPNADMPAMPSLSGSFPPPYPPNPYPPDPYYNPTIHTSHTPTPPTYNPDHLPSQPAPTYPSDAPTSRFDSSTGDSNSLDSLVKDFDIDLTGMQSSDHFNM